jgi:outer membrane protein OmpA-like peptidoglycan-associated protein/tetratricopeptide (TPR) repeat protein
MQPLILHTAQQAPITASPIWTSNRPSWNIRVLRCLLLLVLLGLGGLFAGGEVQAQTLLDRAEAAYAQLAYSEAAPLFEQHLEKASKKAKGNAKKSAQLAPFRLQLAECYRLTQRYDEAIASYAAVLEGRPFSDSVAAVHALRYAQTLHMRGRYEEAETWYLVYRDRQPQDPRASLGLASCRAALAVSRAPDGAMDQNGGRAESAALDAEAPIGEDGRPIQRRVFQLENLPFNSPSSDFGAIPDGDRLWFASARGDAQPKSAATDGWTGEAYLDLYAVDNWMQTETGDSSQAAAKAAAIHLNGPYHEGPGSITPDGQSLLLTRNLDPERGSRARRAEQPVLGLGIFRANRLIGEDGSQSWGAPFPERIPGLKGTHMHPTLSADGQVMVFAAVPENGRGGFDLMQVRREGEGWSTAEALDPGLNSPGDELHPYLDADGNLWFASDGRGGQGGLDLFVARRLDFWDAAGQQAPDGKAKVEASNSAYDPWRWAAPRRLEAPFNSSYDDFGLVWIQADTLGLLASNRPGGQGSDDLYLVQRRLPSRVPGLVLAPDSLPFGGAEILAVAGRDTTALTASADGRFDLQLYTGTRVDIWARSPGFQQTHLGFVFRSPERFAEQPATIVLQPRASVNLLGQVVQGTTGEPVGHGLVHVMRENGDTILVLASDEEGFFVGELPIGAGYSLEVDLPGYLGEDLALHTDGFQPGEDYTVLAEVRKLGADMVVELNNIYYDYGKADIRSDAVADLEKLRSLLETYPGMTIEIGAHTDTRSSAAFNQDLSQRRAESARRWLTEAGIEADRIATVGYGETKPRNRCTEGVDCAEDEHQFNRRTEFRIVYFDEVISSKARDFAPGSVASPWDRAAAREAFQKADSLQLAQQNRVEGFEDQSNPWAKGTAYGVQVGIDKKANSDRFDGFEWLGEIRVEASGRGFYRYVIGYVSERGEAEQIRQVLRDAGITDAFLVTYVDGVRQ